MGSKILTHPKSTLEWALHEKKSAKMHWYVYNYIVPLLNIAKTQIFHPIYDSIFLNLAPFYLPACLPAIRTGTTCSIAPDFLHKKGNCV